MIKILWILNKYVTGDREQKHFPSFLNQVQYDLKQKDIVLRYVLFSDLLQGKLRQESIVVYSPGDSPDNVHEEAKSIENEYNFTFKEAYFSDAIQLFPGQNGRKIEVPEDVINDVSQLTNKFRFIEDVIVNSNCSFVFSDQSPEVEMEFARIICLKHNIPYVKQTSSYLGRSTFHLQKAFGEEKLLLIDFDIEPKSEEVIRLLDDFVAKGKAPYDYDKTVYSSRQKLLYYIASNKGFGALFYHLFLAMMRFIHKSINILWLKYEYVILKHQLRYRGKDIYSEPYFFYGFHLLNESTVGLRAQPFMNQLMLIQAIARVLPHGLKLYVREHPVWHTRYSYRYLKQLKDISNVRLISTKTPSWRVISQSSGVITLNGTNGIEALFHSKPVLSFAPNVYSDFHPAALHCTNLFDIGAKLVQLRNTVVSREDTVKYVKKLLSTSSEVLLGSEGMLSEDDANRKAHIFASNFFKINMYFADRSQQDKK